jgi:hypothetical protein
MSRSFNHLTVLLALGVIAPVYVSAQQTNTAGKVATKNYNHIRFADKFNGDTGGKKQEAAVSDLGDGPGLVIAAPGMGTGSPRTYRDKYPILDLRQTSDIIGDSTSDPDRAPLVLLENHLGEFTTKPLAGIVILTRGSIEVRGIGTKFLSELAHHLGRSVKLNADATTAWVEVASVGSDTEATLKAPYPGGGCSNSGCTSGNASYFITQLGFAIRNTATAGTPNTTQGGESVGLTVFSDRTGGERGLYGANLNVTYGTAAGTTQGQALGLEIDLSNMSGSDDTTAISTYGLDILSAGKNRPDAGIVVNSTTNAGTNANNWLRGAFITGWSQVGMLLQGSQNHLQFFTGAAPDSNPQVGGRNSNDTAYIWNVNNDGSAKFSGVVNADRGIASAGSLPITAGGADGNITLTPGGSGVISAASFITLHSLTVSALPAPSAGNAGQIARVSDSTAVSTEGQTCMGGSSSTALAFSDGTKWKCF